jgi:cytidylate kinase
MFHFGKEPLPLRVEQRIRAQIEGAQRYRQAKEPPPSLPFATVSRQYGCEAMEFAGALAEVLTRESKLPPAHWQVYNRQIIESISAEAPLATGLLESLDVRARSGLEEFFQTLVGHSPPDIEVLKLLVRVERALAHHGHCILVGRGGAMLTRDLPNGIHVRLVAPEEWRQKSLVTRFGWDAARARQFIREEDENRSAFFRKYLNQDVNDPLHYDLILNVARLDRDEQVESAAAVFRQRFSR